MIDLAALKIFLETNPGFNADVRGGHNGVIRNKLNAEDGTLPRRWRPISGDDFLDALANETLTARQEERIRTYTAEGRSVPVHRPRIRAWVQAQGFAASTIQGIRDLAEVAGKPGDQFLGDDDEAISIRDVRIAVAQISKAHINQPPPLRDPNTKLSRGIKKDPGSPLKEFDEP